MSITKDIWSSLLRRGRRSSLFVFLALTLASSVLSPAAQAQLSPAPDGGYPGYRGVTLQIISLRLPKNALEWLAPYRARFN